MVCHRRRRSRTLRRARFRRPVQNRVELSVVEPAQAGPRPDLGSAGPGLESADSSRHGVEPRQDPRESEKANFVELVVDEIGRAHAARSFDQFVLVAPPKVVGEIRRVVPDALKAVLKCTVQKDLTNTPDHDLAAHLSPEALRDAS
ncbi:host attachment protein [Methyloceanibacter methanicus]|uniref:host attachment protein n=1 Tax=Methyloceanibacter methanicus TaxID=1774968 RepID=UPI001FCDC95B|nr:host attachment protein [Methyloceanibacter methanicus]